MKKAFSALPHQYIDRRSGQPRNERLFNDPIVRHLYGSAREVAPMVFKFAISRRTTGLLGWLNYDLPIGGALSGNRKFLAECGVDLDEALDPPEALDSVRKVFERKIRYWDCRPMPEDETIIVSPADSRVLVGSLSETSVLFLKNKFFDLTELLGREKRAWLAAFARGSFAIFRLTPDKYHYNHTPVAGVIRDVYEVRGNYHACNPAAIVAEVTPYSKNTRTVTMIDTDVADGSQVGLVAMIEVTALMIGEVMQCYSREKYDEPRPVVPGMFVERGCPKSLYRPGSSTDVLLFEPGRVAFDQDLLHNQQRAGVQSRFSAGFGRPLVETEVEVRSQIATSTSNAKYRQQVLAAVVGGLV